MLTTEQLADRYGVNVNQIYKRKRSLIKKGVKVKTITKDRKAYIDDAAICLFDSQHQHVKAGLSLDSFIVPIDPVVLDSLPRYDTGGDIAQSKPPVLSIAPESIEAIALAVAQVLSPLLPPPDPTWKFEALRTAARFKYQLSSSQVRDLIGVTPKKNSFSRGSFEFVKVGKIGRENAWIITQKVEPTITL